jgi:hypothetical protein
VVPQPENNIKPTQTKIVETFIFDSDSDWERSDDESDDETACIARRAQINYL